MSFIVVFKFCRQDTTSLPVLGGLLTPWPTGPSPISWGDTGPMTILYMLEVACVATSIFLLPGSS